MNILQLVYSLGDSVRGLLEALPRPMRQDVQVPYSVRAVRDSFGNLNENGLWVFALLGAVILVVIGWSVWRWWKSPKGQSTKQIDDPEKLFRELLKQLELCQSDKKLLVEMARGARLREPAFCMLSPGTLDWTRMLWREEKGDISVTQEKFDRIDAIAVQLYDHHSSQN